MDRPNLDRLRAELAARREVMATVVADLRTRARTEVERLRATEPPQQHKQVADDEYDTQGSWMVSGYNSGAGTSPAHQPALDKIESGALTWKDVFSDTTSDRDARALRGFLDQRFDEVQRMRNGR